MDSITILNQYLSFCNVSSSLIQHNLAQNSCLEWFGRTIKGKNKIFNFLRYEIYPNYKHNFSNAQACDPIEYRPNHTITKHPVPSELNLFNDSERKYNLSTPCIEFQSTVSSLTRIKSLLSVDQDKELLSDLGLNSLDESVTNTTPYKIEPINEPPGKKPKLETIYAPKFPEQINLPMTETIATLEENSDYSKINYIQSVGTLITSNQRKHRSVCLNSSLQTSESFVRDTKLKISYRIRVKDNSIVFLLIIYEQSIRNPNLRRNLYLEFEEAAKIKQNTSTSKKNHCKNSVKKKLLKRTLF